MVLIDAKTARQLVENSKKSVVKKQFDILCELIHKGIQDDEYSTNYDGAILEENKTRLEGLGYGVGKPSSFRNETSTTISW